MATGTLSYAIWRHAPRGGEETDIVQEDIDAAPAEAGTGVVAIAENEVEVGTGGEDFIRYASSSFGLSQGFVLHADGSFRIDDAIAKFQQRGPGCTEGSIPPEDFTSIAEYIVSSGFFGASNDAESDFAMCEGGYSLEVRIGTEQRSLQSVCMQHPTEEVLANDKLVDEIIGKVRILLEASGPEECSGASSEGE